MDSSTVYIGSIPFDQTEEQVLEIAKSIGPVSDMKLLFDPLTGKSKGSAFVKYSDYETAASAVRNLNNFMLGNRPLKCSFTNESTMYEEDNNSNNDNHNKSNTTTTNINSNTTTINNNNNNNNNNNANRSNNSLPPLPPGMSLFPNQTPPQAVSAVLATFDQSQLFSLIVEAKKMCQTNPKLAKSLFEKYPQLSHALVESSLMLNLTNPDVIQLCLNKSNSDLDSLNSDQEILLKNVYKLTDQDLINLPEDKREIVMKIKQEIEKGTYGNILN